MMTTMLPGVYGTHPFKAHIHSFFKEVGLGALCPVVFWQSTPNKRMHFLRIGTLLDWHRWEAPPPPLHNGHNDHPLVQQRFF